MNKLIKKLSRHFEIFNETRRIRRCYESHIARIRNRRAGTKIKVLFIVSEIAKWKEQSLYKVTYPNHISILESIAKFIKKTRKSPIKSYRFTSGNVGVAGKKITLPHYMIMFA